MSSDALALPAWKTAPCAKCGSLPGKICIKLRRGTVNHWIRTAPHAVRVRAAAHISESTASTGAAGKD